MLTVVHAGRPHPIGTLISTQGLHNISKSNKEWPTVWRSKVSLSPVDVERLWRRLSRSDRLTDQYAGTSQHIEINHKVFDSRFKPGATTARRCCTPDQLRLC